MNSDILWHAGRRLLGFFFLVQGCLVAASAIGVFGLVVPDGSSRAGLAAATLVQAGICIAAGIWLVQVSARQAGPEAPAPELRDFKRSTLQLLGVFFLITGLLELARPLASMFSVTEAWQLRVSELVGGAVGVLVGAALVLRPTQITQVLDRHAGA